jgi:hypothetical protein
MLYTAVYHLRVRFVPFDKFRVFRAFLGAKERNPQRHAAIFFLSLYEKRIQWRRCRR